MSMFLMANFWLLFPAALTAAAALILLSRSPKWNDYLALSMIVAGLIAAWITLHPRQTPLLADSKAVQQTIGAGVPVLLEFQSPFCIVCTQLKPVVDDLEQELGERVHMIRINVHESIGNDLAPVYGIEFAPTFIFFDAQGAELWRQIGDLNTQQVRDSVK
jgi:thioredoxin 1